MYALNEHKDAADATYATLELVAALACGDETLSLAVVNRAVDYMAVEKDLVRMAACDLLSFCLGQFLSVPTSILKGKNKGRSFKMEGWKVECGVGAGKALILRCTDKITRVRAAAISGCGWFFKCENEELSEVKAELEQGLVWLASNDTSAANRALAVGCLPVSEENLEAIVVRLKDVDVKVREAALEALREKASVDDLGEDVMVEILRNGLTKR